MKSAILLVCLALAGCVSRDVPPIHVHTKVATMLGDPATIGRANAIALAWPGSTWRTLAEQAYWHHFRARRLEAAAHVADAFGLGTRYANLAATEASSEDDFVTAVRIVCGHGASDDARDRVIAQVLDGERYLSYEAVLQLRRSRCPLRGEQWRTVLEAALMLQQPDIVVAILIEQRALRPERVRAVATMFNRGQCREGIRAFRSLDLEDEDIPDLIRVSDCETELLAWPPRLLLPPRETMHRMFAEALRWKNLLLAYALCGPAELAPKACTDRIIRHAFRVGAEPELLTLCTLLPRLRATAFDAALALGRTRTATLFQSDPKDLRRAFDAAVAIGRYEDAAEIAELFNWKSKTQEGILTACQAARSASMREAVRRLDIRYGTRDCKPLPPRPRPVKRTQPQLHRCTDADPWQVTKCRSTPPR
jgi:hypothetical protein